MTITLYDLAYRVMTELQNIAVEADTEAGGSTTTTVFNSAQTTQFPDDYFNDKSNPGSLFVIDTSDDAAPKGEFAIVTDWVNSTSTATHAALTTAALAGDYVALAMPRYPLNIVIQQVNAALREWGGVETVDTSSLTTASEQTEYTLPAAKMDLREVYVQGQTDDSDKNLWRPVPYWYVQKTAGGSADTLVFSAQPPNAYTIKLVYYTPHTRLQASSDSLDESVDERWVVLKTALNMLNWRLNRLGVASDPRLNAQINSLRDELTEHSAHVPHRRHKKQARTWRAKGALSG